MIKGSGCSSCNIFDSLCASCKGYNDCITCLDDSKYFVTNVNGINKCISCSTITGCASCFDNQCAICQ
jgi:hypothetical protein